MLRLSVLSSLVEQGSFVVLGGERDEGGRW